jgi:hypothetical protein
MDELHSAIFGRPNVTGARVLSLWRCFQTIPNALGELDNRSFATYNLTKFFLFYAVMEVIKADSDGQQLLKSLDAIAAKGKIDELAEGFSVLAQNTTIDLNAEIAPEEDEYFDYKNELKSQKWCKTMSAKLLAQYKKDIRRDKAETVTEIFGDLLS